MYLFQSLFVAILSLSVVACRAVGPDAEALLGITAGEVNTRSRAALDPKGIIANAKSIRITQDKSYKSISMLNPDAYVTVEMVSEFKAPNLFKTSDILDGKTIKSVLYDGNQAWNIDESGITTQVTGLELDILKFGISHSHAGSASDNGVASLTLEESDQYPDTWYRLVYTFVNPGIPPRIEYIDQKSFLVKRFIWAGITCDITSYREIPIGEILDPSASLNGLSRTDVLLIPHEHIISGEGYSEKLRLKNVKIGLPLQDSDFSIKSR